MADVTVPVFGIHLLRLFANRANRVFADFTGKRYLPRLRRFSCAAPKNQPTGVSASAQCTSLGEFVAVTFGDNAASVGALPR